MLLAAGSGERDAAHTVVEEFGEELASRHVAIAYGEEETVAYRLSGVVVVYDVEAIVGEDTFHLFGTVGILAGVFYKVNLTFGREAQHLGIGILCRGCAARGDHI